MENSTISTGRIAAAAGSAKKTNARKNDDVHAIKINGKGIAILVGDGATGIGFGDRASSILKELFEKNFEAVTSPQEALDMLVGADHAISMSLMGDADTTGIIMSVTENRVFGASAGDSAAFIFGKRIVDITKNQRRKPRIGNGAHPIPFAEQLLPGEILVVASDGLWNAVSMDLVRDTIQNSPNVETLVQTLLSISKDANSTYQDDVTVVCVSLEQST